MNQKPLSTAQILIMAATTGITIANVYYAQPILAQIAAAFGADATAIGRLPALTQAGVGIGLFFLAPLGDMLDRKMIVIVLELLLAVVLAGMACSGSLLAAYACSFAIGVLAVAVQILVPMAAALSQPGAKGKTLGIVFTGTLTGILAARIFSGYIAQWLGWRWVYGLSAGLALAVALLVLVTLPRQHASQQGRHTGSYGALLASTVRQFGRFARLRRISCMGALVFGAFCSFWTTLTLLLSAAPFNYRSDQIGLFGLVAIGGAMVAPWFGRMADKASPERAQILTTGLIVCGVLCVTLWPASLAAFVLATLLIDIGVQGTQVNNLAQLYALDETAHSRINTVFMTIFFLGGALGTLVGVLAWGAGGWPLVVVQLLVWSALAMVVAVLNHRASLATA